MEEAKGATKTDPFPFASGGRNLKLVVQASVHFEQLGLLLQQLLQSNLV